MIGTEKTKREDLVSQSQVGSEWPLSNKERGSDNSRCAIVRLLMLWWDDAMDRHDTLQVAGKTQLR